MKYSEYQPRSVQRSHHLNYRCGRWYWSCCCIKLCPTRRNCGVHGRTLNKLEVIYDEIEGLGAPQPAILPLQLSSASPRDYELLVDTLQRQFGRLDGIFR